MTFGLAEDGSRCNEGEEVAALSKAVHSERIASCNSSTCIDRLFVSTDVSTDAKEDQGQFQGEQ